MDCHTPWTGICWWQQRPVLWVVLCIAAVVLGRLTVYLLRRRRG